MLRVWQIVTLGELVKKNCNEILTVSFLYILDEGARNKQTKPHYISLLLENPAVSKPHKNSSASYGN
jgi:hypothetical protein